MIVQIVLKKWSFVLLGVRFMQIYWLLIQWKFEKKTKSPSVPLPGEEKKELKTLSFKLT